jgi:hypothetical protein
MTKRSFHLVIDHSLDIRHLRLRLALNVRLQIVVFHCQLVVLVLDQIADGNNADQFAVVV